MYGDMYLNELKAKKAREKQAAYEANWSRWNGHKPYTHPMGGAGTHSRPVGASGSTRPGRSWKTRSILLLLFGLHFYLFPLFGLPNIFGLL